VSSRRSGSHIPGEPATIGIAVGLRQSADEMLRDADLALYRSEANGKDCHVFYSRGQELASGRLDADRHPVG